MGPAGSVQGQREREREIMLFIGKPMGRSIMISNIKDISNTTTERLKLQEIYGPNEWAPIEHQIV
jgi:hypothetical protein